MAAPAFGAEPVLMRIVPPMTGSADSRCRVAAGHRLPVTVGAGDTRVAVDQRETGSGAVVEIPGEPRARIVTACARSSQAVTVRIVLTMASQAVGRRIMKGRGRVAFLAFHGCVTTDQRKGRQVVFEQDLRRPRLLAMAVDAPFAQLAEMGVVIGMASRAAVGQRRS